MKATPFAIEALRAAAGDTAYQRGLVYFEQGRVEITRLRATSVRARVRGGEDYAVELAMQDARPAGRCTCRANRDFGFCKHMVAAALAANDSFARGEAGEEDPAAKIAAYLDALDREALKKLILDRAESDDDFARKLSLAAEMKSGKPEAIARRLKREIDAATNISGSVGYDDEEGWITRAAEPLEALEAALAVGAGALVLSLVERYAERLREASEETDDSEGEIFELLEKAAQLHLAACRIAKPDPVALAGELLERELDDEPGYADCIATYADVLGEAGQAEMVRLARKAWEEIPPAGRGDGYSESTFRRRCLAGVLDHAAEAAGDLDARVAIRSRHLAQPSDYLELAQFCAAHGRENDALKCAEEALFVFEDENDARLATFAAELFSRRGRGEEARAVLWRAFSAHPSEDLFGRIVADLQGEPRAQATDRAVAALKASAVKPGYSSYGARDLALVLLMNERRFADAWTFAGTFDGPASRLLKLAEASEASHPQQAAEVYRRIIEEELSQGGNPAYERAKMLIDRLGALARRSRAEAAHEAYVADVLARHRAKRNFVKLMGAKR